MAGGAVGGLRAASRRCLAPVPTATQARLPAEVPDRSGADPLWFDYVADLDNVLEVRPTPSARLLAIEELKLDWIGQVHVTERGRILAMGGDQVYPVPKAVEYKNRTIGS